MKASLTARIILAIVFVGLLATPLAIKRVSARQQEAQEKLNKVRPWRDTAFIFRRSLSRPG